MKKIVHLGKYSPDENGGIERVSKCVECSISSYVSTNIYFSKEYSSFSEKTVICKQLFSILNQPISFRYLFWAFKETIKSDKVIFHYPNYLSLFVLICIPWKIKQTIVFFHSDVVGKGILGYLLKPFSWFVFSRAKKVVGLTIDHKYLSEFNHLFRNKFAVVPALDFSSYGSHMGDRSPRADRKSSISVNLLCIGRIVDYKNFSFALRLMSVAPGNFNLRIVGSGPGKERLSAEISKYDLQSRVKILSNLDDCQLKNILNDTDVYLMVSNTKAEMFGIVQLEAMLNFVPVIASSIEGSAVHYPVKRFGAGKISKLDEQLFLKSIEDVISIDFDWGTIRENINNEFNQAVVSKTLRRIIECVE